MEKINKKNDDSKSVNNAGAPGFEKSKKMRKIWFWLGLLVVIVVLVFVFTKNEDNATLKYKQNNSEIVVEISPVDFIKSHNCYDEDVIKMTLDITEKRMNNTYDDFFTLFGIAFEEVDNNSLVIYFALDDKCSDLDLFDTTNEYVVRYLRNKFEKYLENIGKMLAKRVGFFYAGEGRFLNEGDLDVTSDSSGHIRISIYGKHLSEEQWARLINLIQTPGCLELYATYRHTGVDEKDPSISSYIERANAELANRESSTSEEGLDEAAKKNPLFRYLNVTGGSTARIGIAKSSDISEVNRMLESVSYIFPKNLKFAWSAKPVEENSDDKYYELIALKGVFDKNNKLTCSLGGEVITDARQDYDLDGNVAVSMRMDNKGTKEWERLTKENIGKQIAIVFDDKVYSYPIVNQEIPNGRLQISGDLTIEEAKDLANILKAGKLPPVRVVETVLR